ncbi:M16 family metallopeptidase [Pseudaeromonas sharmana]
MRVVARGMGACSSRLLRIVCCVACLVLVIPASATPRLLAEQKAEPGSLAIPYQKYRLENGLTLILHADHSDPLVHVNVTYHVGSSREQQGTTGFAHFFEHMMFQGSKHVGDQQHLQLIQQAGGSVNGQTGNDVTRYYQTVPANELERVLWLESDRMGFLLEAVSQKKFEIQRDTVKNERAQRIDNPPYGRIGEVMGESLYPRDHPYSWPVIGYIDDLNRVDVNDLKRFFLAWYGPNNATLTIGGDFDPAQALAWVEQYFGPIPTGPAIPRLTPRPVSLAADRHVTLQDRIQQPVLLVSIPTHALPQSDDAAALLLLGEVLGGSKNSLFYQQLVKTGLAVQASADFSCRELDCRLDLTLVPNTQRLTSLKPLAEQAARLLANFAERGVRADDLARVQGILKAEAIWRLESVAGKVDELSDGEVMQGDPQAGLAQIRQLQAVTGEQVMQAYRRHIAGKPAVWLSVIPQGALQWQVAPADYQPMPRIPVPPLHQTAPALRTVTDRFDRARMPESGPAPVLSMPTLWRRTLGGLSVLGSEQRELPAVSVIISLPGGRRTEARHEAGLANLTALMLRQGSRRLSAEQLSDELQRLGANISVSSGLYDTRIVISALQEALPKTLALAQELLQQPGFRDDDFARIKSQLLQAERQRLTEPDALADRAFNRLVYGSGSPLAEPEQGYLATLGALTLTDVKRYYRDNYHPAGGKVVVVGDIDPQAIMPHLAFLTQDSSPARPLPSLVPQAPQAKPGIYLLDLPAAVQSTLRIGRRALPYDASGPYFRAQLMNFNFGGNFNSRLNLALREEKGFTYGIGSHFSAVRDVGEFMISGDVRADATLEALQTLAQLMSDFAQQGPTAAEMDYLKSAFSRQEALAYETLDQKADFLLSLALRGNPDDYIQRQQQQLQQIDAASLQQVAAQWLDWRQQIIVIVGDAAQLEKPLAKLHLPLHRYPAAASVVAQQALAQTSSD